MPEFKYPPTIYIEITSSCNLRCPNCPRTYVKRPSRHMNMEMFRKIIDDIEEHKKQVSHIGYHFFGEGLLNPNFFEMLEYAGERIPEVETGVSINANFLDREKATSLASSSLSTIGIWPDAVTRETYAKYRKGGSLERCVDSIRAILKCRDEQKKNFEVHIGMNVNTSNIREISQFIKFWKNLVSGYERCNIRLNYSHDWASQIPSRDVYYKMPRRLYMLVPCTSIFATAVITVFGDITPCCYDINSTLKIGSIDEGNISEAWNSKAARRLRHAMRKLQMPPDMLCSSCHKYKIGAKRIYRSLRRRLGIPDKITSMSRKGFEAKKLRSS